METAARKLREGRLRRAAKEEVGKITQSLDVIRDRGYNLPHLGIPNYCAQIRKLCSEEADRMKVDSLEVGRWRRAVWVPWAVRKTVSGS